MEALSATGLRSIRYARELPGEGVHSIFANDLDPAAVQAIRRNIEFNLLRTSVEEVVTEPQGPPAIIPNLGDAMYLFLLRNSIFMIIINSINI